MIPSMDKTPLQSKKWVAMLLGVLCALIVFLSSVVTMVVKPDIADHVGSLANTVVVFLATMISVLITGQSAVDWKHTSAVGQTRHIDETVTVEKKQVEVQVKRDNNHVIERFWNRYKDDASYKPINRQTEMWT